MRNISVLIANQSISFGTLGETSFNYKSVNEVHYKSFEDWQPKLRSLKGIEVEPHFFLAGAFSKATDRLKNEIKNCSVIII